MIFRKKKIGLALCGGAARALSHIGVLKVLDELGVKIDAVSGTSMGAIVGSFYCSGVPLEEIEDYVNSMDWRSIRMFSDITLTKMGIINGRKVEKILSGFLKGKTFEQCCPQFCCVAVDMLKQERVVLSSGSLVDAVRASISIPGLFSPVTLDDMILVDGGVIEPLPTEALKDIFDVDIIIAVAISTSRHRDLTDYYQKISNIEEGNRFLVALKKAFVRPRTRKHPHTYEILNTSFNIIQRELTRKYCQHADIIIEPQVGDYGFFEFTKGREIMEKGLAAAREKIPEIKKKLNV
ncbi:MAG: patatin-like phospholipase family protein [Actinomycetota bacterium]